MTKYFTNTYSIISLHKKASTKSEIVGKPEKDFFELVLKDLDLSARESIMIGDDLFNDVEGAQLAGLKGVLVKTGKYRRELVEKSSIKPDLIISSISEIKDYLLQMRTALIAIISYFFGDIVNPIYLFVGLYALSALGLYFFWKWNKKNKTIN